MEKAWAKIHGSWARMEGGQPVNPYIKLSGFPAYNMDIGQEGLWERFVSCDSKDYVMGVCSPSHPQGHFKTMRGIAQGHAYTLIGTHEFEAHG